MFNRKVARYRKSTLPIRVCRRTAFIYLMVYLFTSFYAHPLARCAGVSLTFHKRAASVTLRQSPRLAELEASGAAVTSRPRLVESLCCNFCNCAVKSLVIC